MAPWRQLSAEKLNKGEERTEQGVVIHVFLSPYDVPEGVRGEYDEKSKVFRIEFKYLTDEESTEISEEGKSISLVVGRNSKRLLGISVDVHSLKADSIQLKLEVLQLVEKAIAELEDTGKPKQRKANYRLARRVIDEHRDELLAPLGAT